MRRTSAYIISFLLLSVSSLRVQAQDTISIPLKIKLGLEVSGPAIYFSDKNVLNLEGYISTDINEKISAVIATGFLNYNFTQYNGETGEVKYEYFNKGNFIRAGLDFNMLKPEKSLGRNWLGIGLRYGLSRFVSEVPSFQHTNYWGRVSSSVSQKTDWGHFFEISPFVRTEVFKNFSLGWTISLRKLLYTTTSSNLRPIYFPGFGNGGKSISTGLTYFMVWNIPYKKINVIIKKEVPEETEDTSTIGK